MIYLKEKNYNLKMQRRKFLFLITFGSVGTLATNSIVGSKKIKRLKSLLTIEQENMITNYNNNRKNVLKTNLKGEIKKDLIKNRTIWIGKRLYTFAELKDF